MADLTLSRLSEQEKSAIVVNDEVLREVYG